MSDFDSLSLPPFALTSPHAHFNQKIMMWLISMTWHISVFANVEINIFLKKIKKRGNQFYFNFISAEF
jgi:hypothetical protein